MCRYVGKKGSVGLFILFIFLDANVHTKTQKKKNKHQMCISHTILVTTITQYNKNALGYSSYFLELLIFQIPCIYQILKEIVQERITLITKCYKRLEMLKKTIILGVINKCRTKTKTSYKQIECISSDTHSTL